MEKIQNDFDLEFFFFEIILPENGISALQTIVAKVSHCVPIVCWVNPSGLPQRKC